MMIKIIIIKLLMNITILSYFSYHSLSSLIVVCRYKTKQTYLLSVFDFMFQIYSNTIYLKKKQNKKNQTNSHIL